MNENQIYVIKKNHYIKLGVDDNILKIKLDDVSSSYSYDELIECNKKFRAFDSVEHIHSFILSSIEKEEIEIEHNQSLTLKQFNIVIPLDNQHRHLDSLVNDLVNNASIECFKSSSFGIKLVQTIKSGIVFSMCFLRDGRLVSGGNKIMIYNKRSFEPDIIISAFSIYSVCGLRNGNLAYGGFDKNIKICQINRNESNCIHTLEGHTKEISRIIQLEDGRLCSCSNEIIIWDENYQPIQILRGDTNFVGIIEMKNYIISVGSKNNKILKIWNKETRECVKEIKDVYCVNNNGLSKLKDNAVIFAGDGILFIVDILSFESKPFQDKRLKGILSILVLREDQILLGTLTGEVMCYNSISNQIIFTQSMYNQFVSCIIKTEDNKVVSSSLHSNINIYDLVLMQ